MKLRALSVRQPFVEQILCGRKRAEFRNRPTKIRGKIYLYASLRPADGMNVRADLPTGLIVGTAEVIDCRKSKRWPGTWEWVLKNPRRLRQPFKPRQHPQPAWFYPR